MDENKVESVETETKADKTEKTPSADEMAKRLRQLEAENEKLRKANTAASADASEWKKKFRSTQDEAERAEAERKELFDAIKAENEALKKNQTMAMHNAGWLECGFSADMAKVAAEATVNNDFDALMDIVKKFITEHDKTMMANAIKQTPSPISGGETQGMTKETFNNLSYSEMVKLYTEQPEVYKQMMGS